MTDGPIKDRPPFSEPNLTPKTFSEALIQHPEVKRLNHEEAVVLHGMHILESTNRIRLLIEKGHFFGKSSREIFDEIHRIHFGTNRITQLIALFDAEIMTDNLPTLDDFASDIDLSRYMQYSPLNKDMHSAIAPNLVEPRKVEISMIRFGAIIGTPAETLPIIEEALFNKVDDFRKQHELNPKTDEDIYAFTLAAATVLDTIHTRPDGNGRSSEDWMVALQYELFKGDTSKIKTWSLNGLRGKGLTDIKDKDLQLPNNLVSIYKERDDLLLDRGRAIGYFRQKVLRLFLSQFQVEDPQLKLAVDLDSNMPEETRRKILTQVVFEHKDILVKTYQTLIADLNDLKTRQQFGLENPDNPQDLTVVEILKKYRTKPYHFIFLAPNDFPNMQEVKKRLANNRSIILDEEYQERLAQVEKKAREEQEKARLVELLTKKVVTSQDFSAFISYALNAAQTITRISKPEEESFVFPENHAARQQLHAIKAYLAAVFDFLEFENLPIHQVINIIGNNTVQPSQSRQSLNADIDDLRNIVGSTIGEKKVSDILNKKLLTYYKVNGGMFGFIFSKNIPILIQLLEGYTPVTLAQ